MVGRPDEGGRPPDPEREIDQLLRSIRFSPRASLGPELWGALPRGGALAANDSASARTMLSYAAVALIIGLGVFLLWRTILPGMRLNTVDRCCADLDGGGIADDGIRVTTRNGEAVRGLTIYEDRDGSGNFTRADTVRFSRGQEPIVAPSFTSGLGVTRLCCADYDGGGKSDDGLLILGTAPDRIALAAIYEGDGHAPPVLR